MCRTVIKLSKNWDYFEWITFNYFMRPKSFKKEGKKSETEPHNVDKTHCKNSYLLISRACTFRGVCSEWPLDTSTHPDIFFFFFSVCLSEDFKQTHVVRINKLTRRLFAPFVLQIPLERGGVHLSPVCLNSFFFFPPELTLDTLGTHPCLQSQVFRSLRAFSCCRYLAVKTHQSGFKHQLWFL